METDNMRYKFKFISLPYNIMIHKILLPQEINQLNQLSVGKNVFFCFIIIIILSECCLSYCTKKLSNFS